MATATKKELSRWLSGYMDDLGFDRRRIRERIHVYNRCSWAKDISTKDILKTNDIEKIFVGSMREGIGMNYINDKDVLQINHAVSCLEACGQIDKTSKLVFKMIRKNAPAGYTFLKLMSNDEGSDAMEKLKYALVRTKRGQLLSSKLFMTKNDDVFSFGDGIISRNTHYKHPQGPSIPKFVESNMTKKYWLSKFNLTDKGFDFVRAFPCHADSFQRAWKTRDRHCSWPCQKTIEYVMSLPVYVVPVGQRGSANEDLQWRISFIMAETHLVQDFNNTQTKVFVLMKLIAKHILQPKCKDITSYVVKMVILWLAEKIPKRKFRKKHLLARLQDALVYLKTSVENKCLPNYMMPAVNLFKNKIAKTEQKQVIDLLNVLLDNGNKLIEDYSHSRPFQNYIQVANFCQSLGVANHLDKLQACCIALFTTEEFANYNTKMYLCKSWLHVHVYNTLSVTVPFLFTYGNFTDPLRFELSPHFAKSEKDERAAMKQRRNTTVSTMTAQRQDWHLNTYIADKFGLLFEQFAIFMIVLFLQSKSFKLLLTVLDSDGLITANEEVKIISD